MSRGPAAPDAWTVCIKRTDGTEYVSLFDVNPDTELGRLRAAWLDGEGLRSVASFVSLRRVRVEPGLPSPEEEDAARRSGAARLPDPTATLRAAGLGPICWLLAEVPPSPGARAGASPGQLYDLPDASRDVCARLLHSEGVVPALAQLQPFLEAPLAARLPVSDNWIAYLSKDAAAAYVTALLEPVTANRALALAETASAALRWIWTPGREQHTLLAVEALFVNYLMELDCLAPAAAQLSFQKRRDGGDATSGMSSLSSTGRPVRPDFQLRTSDGSRLLMKGEDKPDTLQKAQEDLTSKMAPEWSPLLYGDMPFLFCYAAAGTSFQLCAILRNDTRSAVPVSRVYDMTRPADRVHLLCLAVQTHRLLQLLSRALPLHVLPADVDNAVTRELPDGTRFTRIITFESASLSAKKRIKGWAAYAVAYGTGFEQLREVYEGTAQCRGLVHAASGPSLRGDTYAVALKPLGLRGADALPTDEAGLRAAAHGVLHGLAALHAAGFVHCDLRWDNVACEPAATPAQRRYFLLDLEACRRAGAPIAPGTELRGWSDATLEVIDDAKAGAGRAGRAAGRGAPAAAGALRRYTAASDMECLGRMLRAAACDCSPSVDCTAFLDGLTAERAAERPSAAAALRHPWIACTGAPCLAAGAPPLAPAARRAR